MMHWSRQLVGAMLLGAGLAASPAAAQTTTRAAIDAACKPGADPQNPGDEKYPGGLSPRGGGLTPQHLPGATTVSVREAKCIIDRFGASVLILAAMDGGEKLPGAIEAGAVAGTAPSIQAEYAPALANRTRGDKTRPIIVYCHHDRCFLSYNVALRTVQAGYLNVFWMRPGITGWKAAGYNVQAPPPPPGAVKVSRRVEADIASCRKSYVGYTAMDWANILHQIPSLAEQEKEFIHDRDEKAKWFKLCLNNVARAATGAADRAEAAKAVTAADGEVAALFTAARREVEANPAKFLSPIWDSHKPAKLRADLAVLKAVKTIEQTCGTIDFSQPAVNGSDDRHVAGLNERRIQHGRCITTYYNDDLPLNKTFGIESANKWVHATQRFTCAATSNRPNCIPNEPFNTIAGIATDANVTFANRQDELFRQQRARVGDLIRQSNAWIAEVNRRVEQFNANH